MGSEMCIRDRTLLGVEIVDESDQEAIDDGNHHEDMRELARQQYEESE